MKPAQLEYLQLITQHQGYLMGYIRSLAPGLSADDVLQEANITLWDKMDQFEPGTNFRAYASKIAYLKTMEALREKKRDQWLIFDSDILENISSYHNSKTEDAEPYHQALRLCLQKLSAKDRQLIHQRYTRGETIRAIAEATRKTEGSLQQAFFRIRGALKACIVKQLKTQYDPS